MANGVAISDVAERVRKQKAQGPRDGEEVVSPMIAAELGQQAAEPEVQAQPEAIAAKGAQVAQQDPEAASQAVEETARAAIAQLPPEQQQDAIEAVQEEGGASPVVQALLAFAPVALGAAFGGAEGGALGAEVGQKALAQLSAGERAQLEAKKRALEAEAKAKAKAEEKKTEFDRKKDLEEIKQKNQLIQIDAKQADRKELEKIKQANAKLLKNVSKKDKPPKSTQFQAATFGKRIEQAESVFDQLTKDGSDPTSISFSMGRALPELVKPESIKQQEQAERNFVNAVLRRESGAAIAASEFESAEAQYFPRIGDSPAVLEQKRLNRQIALQALKAEAGPAFEQVTAGVQQAEAARQVGVPRMNDQQRKRLAELRAKLGR